jgi:hypothetical protein
MNNLADSSDTIPAPVIPAGGARVALIAAEAGLARALADFLAITTAIARTLDEQDAAVREAHDVLTGTVLP